MEVQTFRDTAMHNSVFLGETDTRNLAETLPILKILQLLYRNLSLEPFPYALIFQHVTFRIHFRQFVAWYTIQEIGKFAIPVLIFPACSRLVMSKLGTCKLLQLRAEYYNRTFKH